MAVSLFPPHSWNRESQPSPSSTENSEDMGETPLDGGDRGKGGDGFPWMAAMEKNSSGVGLRFRDARKLKLFGNN